MISDAPTGTQTGTTPGDDWSTLSNELLQGLIHALNNRVAALAAVAELARLGDERVDPVIELPIEIAQLQGVSGLIALLPERRTDAEALELPAALDDAMRLHEHHPRLRSERCEVRFEGTPIPVRAPRWALVRTLVMLVHAAKRAGALASGEGRMPIVVRTDEVAVSVHVRSGEKASPDLLTSAKRAGGEITREADALAFRIPTLPELRRREREARSERD